MRRFLLRATRRLLKEIDLHLERDGDSAGRVIAAGNGRETGIERFLRAAILPDVARQYLDHHLPRLIRTFTLLPPNGGSALELGSYVYGAAVLERVLGYRAVRGAYYGAQPGSDRKTLEIAGQPVFELDIDLFDAETHSYPYPDGTFDAVLCCEVIEHLLRDPMYLLFECRRVLKEGGLLLLTTPNAASLTSVARTLHGRKSPQLFSAYPAPGNADTPHVREYTVSELAAVVTAGGFHTEVIFTEVLEGFENTSWVKPLLEREGFDTAMRGEQAYCLARKQSTLPCERYPRWLYAI
ncbi:MAG TPA: methyltransferase domain-containing protein [Bryobacteraceae bacterium]|nr:methyltransferase domain-containing protein [Bryobacteraceae bacterium]